MSSVYLQKEAISKYDVNHSKTGLTFIDPLHQPQKTSIHAPYILQKNKKVLTNTFSFGKKQLNEVLKTKNHMGDLSIHMNLAPPVGGVQQVSTITWNPLQGAVGTEVLSGTWSICIVDPEIVEGINHKEVSPFLATNISAVDLQTALNAMEVVKKFGGVTVASTGGTIGQVDGQYTITWNRVGAKPAIVSQGNVWYPLPGIAIPDHAIVTPGLGYKPYIGLRIIEELTVKSGSRKFIDAWRYEPILKYLMGRLDNDRLKIFLQQIGGYDKQEGTIIIPLLTQWNGYWTDAHKNQSHVPFLFNYKNVMDDMTFDILWHDKEYMCDTGSTAAVESVELVYDEYLTTDSANKYHKSKGEIVYQSFDFDTIISNEIPEDTKTTIDLKSLNKSGSHKFKILHVLSKTDYDNGYWYSSGDIDFFHLKHDNKDWLDGAEDDPAVIKKYFQDEFNVYKNDKFGNDYFINYQYDSDDNIYNYSGSFPLHDIHDTTLEIKTPVGSGTCRVIVTTVVAAYLLIKDGKITRVLR